MMMKRALAVVGLFAFLGAAAAEAQSVTRVATDTVAGRVLMHGLARAVVAKAQPRSFQVVLIPVPEEIKGSAAQYQLQSEGFFSIVGARAGTVSPSAKDLLVTLGVPADASAGQRVAARAVFKSDAWEIEVPIEMEVAPLYRIVLSTENEIQDLKPGDRFDVVATIRNEGNATDTVRVAYEYPAGWANAARDTQVILLPRASAQRAVRYTVPKKSGTGSFFIRTHATSRGSEANALTTVTVGTGGPMVAPPGPSVRASVSTVAGQNAPSDVLTQLAINGPLTSSVNVDARLTSRPTLGATSIRGLARVGSYVTTPHLAAWSSNWRLGLGSTVADFSDITGVNAGGSGASFTFDDHRTEMQVLAAKPVSGGVGSSGGSIFGAEYGKYFGHTLVSAQGSRLNGVGFGEQRLTSFGVDAQSQREHYTLNGGLAYRDYLNGSGIGFITGAAHTSPRTQAAFRFVHAPGGSAAFARADNEFTGTVTHSINDRLVVGSSMFKSHDANLAASAINSQAISFNQQYRLNERASLRSDLRSSSFDVDGFPFSFGNSERHFGAGGSFAVSAWNYSADLSLEHVTRRVRADEIDAADAGNRLTLHAGASRGMSFGALSIDGGYERNDASTGYLPQQMNISVRADRAQLPVGPRNLYLDGEIGYSRWSNVRSVLLLRTAANYSLPSGIDVSAAIERDPLLFTSSGRAPWIFALRVEKSIGLPRVNTGKSAGVVFQDYNGNGRQDADEPGMANVAVRKGDARAITGRDGRYRFWEEGRGKTEVDVATLPFGWIINDHASSDDIALVPTTRVEVVLQPGAAERLRNVDLTTASVSARDDAGRSWIARRTGPETAVFEALPVGDYTVVVDFSALSEPMHITGTPPQVHVTRETSTRIVVPVGGRALRFKQ